MIELGSRCRDIITGFEGVAIARTTWLYGCERICIEPPVDKDGKVREEAWFDDQRVEVIEEGKPRVSEQSVAASGGPSATRNGNPAHDRPRHRALWLTGGFNGT